MSIQVAAALLAGRLAAAALPLAAAAPLGGGAAKLLAAWRSWQPAPPPAAAAGLRTSAAPRQQQQEPQQQEQPKSANQQAQEASKAFLTGVLDIEELWLSGVAGQLKLWAATKKVPEGKEKEVVEQVRAAYLDTLTRAAAGRELTNRARSHLKQACLAAATYKELTELVGDPEAVEEFVGYSMGGVYSPFLMGGLKLSSWAKRLLLRESSISQAVDTLHTIARDMEGACHCSVQPLSASGDSDGEERAADDGGDSDGDAATPPGQQQQRRRQRLPSQEDPEAAAEAEAQRHHTQYEWHLGAALTVDSCMVSEVLRAEGVPQLLRFFCCQHNVHWLRAYKGQGVDSRLEACIGRGDGCCRIIVEPAAGGGAGAGGGA